MKISYKFYYFIAVLNILCALVEATQHQLFWTVLNYLLAGWNFNNAEHFRNEDINGQDESNKDEE